MMSEENHAIVTLREVYNAVVELKQELSGVPKIMADHEQRLRDLERRVWSFSGIAAVLGAALAQLFNMIMK
jgi:hypothetical protein